MPLATWTGDIHAIAGLSAPWAGVITLAASALCGTLIGLERERRDKPAGLRTVILICLGSTIYTIISLQLGASKLTADPARLAAQIIPGIGFLGAGAIIRSRGQVIGLTTGATIWAVAAVGVAAGAGYIAASLVFTAVILLVLTLGQNLNVLVAGRCRYRQATLVYEPDHGRSRLRLQAILDRHLIPDPKVRHATREDGRCTLSFEICDRHREHRAILHELAEANGVVDVPATE